MVLHSKSHFVLCIKPWLAGQLTEDRGWIRSQMRALQVVETVQLMSSGLAHRMKSVQFYQRYLGLVLSRGVRDCQGLVRSLLSTFVEGGLELGSKHVFSMTSASQTGNMWKNVAQNWPAHPTPTPHQPKRALITELRIIR